MTVTDIYRSFRREWGEDAMYHPEEFDRAAWAEVRLGGARAVAVRGTFGPQVSDNDYFPIPCCNGPRFHDMLGGDIIERIRRGERHEPDCLFDPSASMADIVNASGGVVSFPRGYGRAAAA